MSHLDYTGADVPIRQDLREAQEGLWEHLRRPGAWWSGAERIALAAESRRAVTCPLCRARRAALSPRAAAGEHEATGVLPAPVIDVVHRIRTDPARLSRAWFETVVAGGLEETRYVELVGVVSMVAGVDAFARALGIPPFLLPEPQAGAPSRRRPADVRPGVAWVPMIDPEAAAGPEADLYPTGGFVPNIVRALSLVPDEVRMLRRMSAAHYLAVEDIPNPLVRRDLDRAQIELVAARVSALNQCFYWTTAHAMLLRASGELTGSAVALEAVNGGRDDDGGVAHGALLVRFTEAAMGDDDAALAVARDRLRPVLSPAAFVDTAAVIGSFNVVDRIADATGIPLDDMLEAPTREMRTTLRLTRFASAANTAKRY